MMKDMGWMRRKRRGCESKVWIWYYERPFKESMIFRSVGIFDDRGVLEVYFHHKSDFPANVKATEAEVGNRLKRLFGCDRFICSVSQTVPMLRVSFYCRLGSLPSKEVMDEVPERISEGIVEACFDRWNYRTGEYEGRYSLGDIPKGGRFHVVRYCEGRSRSKYVLGSIWKFVQ